MAPHELGVKKGRINKRGGHVTPSPSIQSLPNDLLVDIFGKVASRSIADLCKIKLSCRDFLIAADDDAVYRHASTDNFALIPLPWFTSQKETSFLKRCRESGNAEISYREGMVQFFSYSETRETGLENLRKAAMNGHDEAKYVCSMMMMNGEDEAERMKGFEVFCGLKAATCRKRVRCLVRNMWVNHPVVRRDQNSLCCNSSSECCGSVMMKNDSRIRWSKDEYADGISCQFCRADFELTLFCNMFEPF